MENADKQIGELTIDYFQRAFEVERTNVSVKFLHLPRRTNGQGGDATQLTVTAKQPVPRLGYQTMWARGYQDGVLHWEEPLTVDVSIKVPVVFAAANIRPGDRITSANVELKKIVVSNRYEELIRDTGDLVGKVATQSIGQGEFVRRRLVRFPPDVARGEQVTVHIKSGYGLTLTLPGKAKRDAFIGEPVAVTCSPTNKSLEGIVDSSDIVIVEVK